MSDRAPRAAGWTRRDWLTFVGGAVGCAALPGSLARAATPREDWSSRPVRLDEPLRQIQRGGPSGLLGVGFHGSLWALSPAAPPRKLADGIDPATSVTAYRGRIVARMVDGGLWIQEDGVASSLPNLRVSPSAGLLNFPLAVIAVVPDGDAHRLARFESGGGRWIETVRSVETVMPDARPQLVALDPRVDRYGHVVVLAGPDAKRYEHGILGDRIEATRMLWIERHELDVLREMTLPAPFVFEDIAPRPIQLPSEKGLLTMRSGNAGTQLAMVTLDASNAKRLRVAALGETVGGPQRWLAPTTDGRRLMAVHTPHMAGVLEEYRLEGDRLTRHAVTDDVTNHHIGTRDIDLAVWLGSLLLVPSQDGRRLRVFDGAKGWAERDAITLPARVVETTALDARSFAVLMEGGAAMVVVPA
jgi:hypothetical protein